MAVNRISLAFKPAASNTNVSALSLPDNAPPVRPAVLILVKLILDASTALSAPARVASTASVVVIASPVLVLIGH
jgi:hypothetical protein